MDRRINVFTGFFVGNLAFFGIYGFICWAAAYLKITPYGRFVATFFKGKKPDEAKAFIEANQALFSEMLPQAVRFSNYVMTPGVGLVAGVIVGLIITPGRTILPNVVWAVLSLAPAAIYFLIKSAGQPDRVTFFLLFVVITAVGGAIGGFARKSLSGRCGCAGQE